MSRRRKPDLSRVETLISDIINNYDIVVFEGHEMVGKSYLMNHISQSLSNKGINVVNIQKDWNCLKCPKGNWYIPNLSLIESSEEILKSGGKMLMDRGLASSYVYMKYYNQESVVPTPETLIGIMKDLNKKYRILYIHKFHSNIYEANNMYLLSQDDLAHDDAYDNFTSGKDLMESSIEFNKLFSDFYAKSKSTVALVTSYSNIHVATTYGGGIQYCMGSDIYSNNLNGKDCD